MQGPTTATMRARLGAQRLHALDGRLGDAGQRALPAGVGGGDDAGLRVGQQDRRAVGRQGAADHPRRCRSPRASPSGRPPPGPLRRRRRVAEWIW